MLDINLQTDEHQEIVWLKSSHVSLPFSRDGILKYTRSSNQEESNVTIPSSHRPPKRWWISELRSTQVLNRVQWPSTLNNLNI
jgi:hypothetical protein